MFRSLTSLIQKNNHRTRNHSLLWFHLVPTDQKKSVNISREPLRAKPNIFTS